MGMTITQGPTGEWSVDIDIDGHTSHHVVSVPARFASSVGWDSLSVPALVRASFEFLLEREPATSIMCNFSLDVIARYFPEYPAAIRRTLRRDDNSS